MSNLAECRTDFCLSYTAPTSGGISYDSTLIGNAIADAHQNLLELRASLRRDSTFKALKEISERYNSVGWDGYNAIPISKRAYIEAVNFIKELPFDIPIPEIVPEPTGEIGLEWRKSNRQIFVLSLGGYKRITFAGILEGKSFHGAEPFIERISSNIFSLIKKVYKD